MRVNYVEFKAQFDLWLFERSSVRFLKLARNNSIPARTDLLKDLVFSSTFPRSHLPPFVPPKYLGVVLLVHSTGPGAPKCPRTQCWTGKPLGWPHRQVKKNNWHGGVETTCVKKKMSHCQKIPPIIKMTYAAKTC